MLLLTTILGLLTTLICVQAQFPPVPEDVTILESKFGDDVYISFKEVGIFSSQYQYTCETNLAAGNL